MFGCPMSIATGRPATTAQFLVIPDSAEPMLHSVRDGRRDCAELEDVGAELKRLRDFIGLTQLQAAYLCRVDVSTISRWERELHTIQRAKRRQVYQVLNALRWAADIQRQYPEHVFTTQELFTRRVRLPKRNGDEQPPQPDQD